MNRSISGVRILIVDDSRTHLALCHKLLKDAGINPDYIEQALTIKEAKALIKVNPPEICFIDYILPDGFGSELLEYIQEFNNMDIHIKDHIISVMMTGSGNEDLVASLFRRGAADYLLKSDFIDRFIPALERAVVKLDESIQNKEKSLFDPITNLLNRSAFIEKAEIMLAEHYRHDQICALIYIDLDCFKEINDSFGHAVGDEYLKSASTRIMNLCRKSDLAGRIGGDEFVVMLRDISRCDLILKVDQWMKDNAECKEGILNTNELRCSVGVAISDKNSYATLDDLISAADQAMYTAKKTGKNKYAFVNTQQLISRTDPSELTIYDVNSKPIVFLKALLNNEFQLCFQPIRDINSLEIQMLEVLIRWPKIPESMSVEAIFHCLSRFDLYDKFHEWLLPRILETLVEWKQQGCNMLFALNAPNTKKGCLSFIKCLKQTLKFYHLDNAPQTLFIVEMNESLLNDDEHFVGQLQHELKSMNVMTSLDQFSRSETKLAHLVHRKFDHMKIRRCDFEQEYDHEYEKVLKLSSFLRMALGCDLIAVGIESLSDLQRVRAAGVDKAQGYFLGAPMLPLDNWPAFIKQFSSLNDLVNR